MGVALADSGEAAFPNIFRLEAPEFEALRQLIHDATGISLAPTKRVLLESRLSKRLRILQLGSFAEYCRYVERSLDNELVPLINCVTTNKTDFFREPHHFAFLREQLLPACEARARASGQRHLRIWSAGCSTGEEPYSIAITVREFLASRPAWDVRILASDIDTNVLETAARGEYPAARMGEMPVEPRQRWFRPIGADGELFEASPDLRSLIAFRRVNLNDEPWPIRSSFDVIFCRNVIIYFNRETQARLLRRFAAFLKPGGHLIVGHSETLTWLSDTFTAVRGQPTVYALSHADRSTNPPPALAPTVTASVAAASLEPAVPRVSATPLVARAMLGADVIAVVCDRQRSIGGALRLAGASHCEEQAGDCDLDALLAQVVAAGGVRANLQAKLFGGNRVEAAAAGDLAADRTIARARRFFAATQIPVVAEHLADSEAREAFFHLDTGRVLIRKPRALSAARPDGPAAWARP